MHLVPSLSSFRSSRTVVVVAVLGLLLLLPPGVVLAALGLAALAGIGATQGIRMRVERRHPPIGRFVHANGTRLHVVERGDPDGVPALFLHGASGNLHDPLSILGDRLPSGVRGIFVDRPGHGHSERRPDARARVDVDHGTVEGQADTMAALLDAMGIERAVVVGHSFGGAVAAAFALAHPERLRGLALVSPVTHPWPGGRMLWYYELAATPIIGPLFAHVAMVPAGVRRMACAVAGVFAPQPVPEGYGDRAAISLALRPASLLANAEDMTRIYASVSRLAPRLGEIRAPTIIIAGREDRIVWTDLHAVEAGRAIGGSRTVLVPGLGHKPDFWARDLVLSAIGALAHKGIDAFDPVIPAVPVRVSEPLTEAERGLETGPDTPPETA